MKRLLIVLFSLFLVGSAEAQTVSSFLTVDQMKSATQAQIITDVTTQFEKMDKKTLVETLTGQKAITTLTSSEDQKEGYKLKVYTTTDVLGNKIGYQRVDWTYYPTGPVNVITTTNYDANDVQVSQAVIQHYTDGRQPTSVKTGSGQ